MAQSGDRMMSVFFEASNTKRSDNAGAPITHANVSDSKQRVEAAASRVPLFMLPPHNPQISRDLISRIRNNALTFSGSSKKDEEELSEVMRLLLGNYPQLRSLSFDSMDMGSRRYPFDHRRRSSGVKPFQALGHILKSNATLTSLKIRNENLSEEIKILRDGLIVNKTITSLDLTLSLGGDSAKWIADVVRVNTTITYLCLNNNQMNEEEKEAITQALADNRTLRELELHMCNFKVREGKTIAEALRVQSSLTSLTLCRNELGDEAGEALGKSLETHGTLTMVNLNGTQLGNRAGKALGKALEKNKVLRELNLGENLLGDLEAKSIAEGLASNVTLTILNLAKNKIGLQGGQAIGLALRTNIGLTGLNLGYNNLEVEAGEAIAVGLKDNHELDYLYLGGNELETSVRSIAEALTKNRYLKTLALFNNHLGSEEIKALFETLQENKSLTELSLGGNITKTDEMKAIAEFLRRNQALTTLDLSGNKLWGIADIELLVKGLVENTSLRVLNLDCNMLGVGRLRPLFKALSKNSTNIMSLTLARNNLDSEGETFDLTNVIRRNRTLTSLDLRGNALRWRGYHMGEKPSDILFALKANKTLTSLDLLFEYELRDARPEVVADSKEAKAHLEQNKQKAFRLALQWSQAALILASYKVHEGKAIGNHVVDLIPMILGFAGVSIAPVTRATSTVNTAETLSDMKMQLDVKGQEEQKVMKERAVNALPAPLPTPKNNPPRAQQGFFGSLTSLAFQGLQYVGLVSDNRPNAAASAPVLHRGPAPVRTGTAVITPGMAAAASFAPAPTLARASASASAVTVATATGMASAAVAVPLAFPNPPSASLPAAFNTSKFITTQFFKNSLGEDSTFILASNRQPEKKSVFEECAQAIIQLIEGKFSIPQLDMKENSEKIIAQGDIKGHSEKWAQIRELLRANADSTARRKTLSRLLRRWAIEFIEEHYQDQDYKTIYEIALITDFDSLINEREESFLTSHEFISLKFFSVEDNHFLRGGKKEETLKQWWNDTGAKKYFKAMKGQATSADGEEDWGSEFEVETLSKVLGIPNLVIAHALSRTINAIPNPPHDRFGKKQ